MAFLDRLERHGVSLFSFELQAYGFGPSLRLNMTEYRGSLTEQLLLSFPEEDPVDLQCEVGDQN
ncbi:hypothetical protein COCC4DRAFT_33734 [Bipolaris maydis ATCC 48331]|uniref:Uncharacterized protein n=2 Tax=Cochliobolus heterostrophus TaxID=5016 RepID=M2SL73_COCH5|nr:uncharacterized protein COCC4DRAFT_33734 [Bipolaris maydis ATCC 48331]EMD86080.1 hypothetical protein COCHEDRAFT_1024260 [Bipolaris maydis C5]ENI02083.1 hypothetical protein COCC4DRAFT_33734 [Bipolaris maydis ATCC 48331]